MLKGEDLLFVGMGSKIRIQRRYLEDGLVINSGRMNAVGKISAPYRGAQALVRWSPSNQPTDADATASFLNPKAGH